jgi:hypothetical protein
LPRWYSGTFSFADQEKAMKTILLIALTCTLSVPLCAATPNAYRKTLAQPTVIQGYPCAKGYAWFYPGDALKSCFLAQDASFGEAKVPAGSYITLLVNGRPRFVQLVQDAPVDGYAGRGGSFLGPSEGPITALYPSGKLRSIYLVGDQAVQGVPCRGGEWGFFTDHINGGNVVEFNQDGKLHACRLTRDFNGVRSGYRITLGP